MVHTYHTIKSASQGSYKEKGSKFLAFAYPVDSEDSIREHVEALRKKYFDARHHCFAWMLGPDQKQYRAFDDGEPNHSAGDPILGQIRSRGLTNVLVVVVRYFGGTKLGVGGLIAAYRSAAGDALNQAGCIEHTVRNSFRLAYSYPETPEVMRMVQDFEIHIDDQNFEEGVMLSGTVPAMHWESLVDRVQLLMATAHTIRLEPEK